MELFFKCAGVALLAMILSLAVGRQERDIALALTLGVCAMVAIVALELLGPVFDFLFRLEAMGDLPGEGVGILLKIAGIGFLSETVAGVCRDGGNSSLGKQLQTLSGVLILGLSLPFLESMLELIERLAG